MAQHARLGPSGISQWAYCAGSVAAQEGIENVSGFFAAEGTAFHEWAADCLEFGLEPEDLYGSVVRVESGWVTDEEGNPVFLNPEIPDPDEEPDEEDDVDLLTGEVRRRAPNFYEFVMGPEFARHMRWGLARVRELATEALLYVEKRVDTSPWCGKGNFGTTDVCIVNREKLEIVIFDWKYGAGVPVRAENNGQIRLYFLGAWETICKDLFEGVDPADITVRLIIEQPRAPAGGGEWTQTVAEILEWGEWVKERAALTYDPFAERTPGESQCLFCRAKRDCGEFTQYLLDMARLRFDELDDAMDMDYAPPLVQPHNLSPEERAFIHRNAKLFKSWLESISQSLMQDYMRGLETPGLKMIIGNKGQRMFVPEEREAAEIELVTLLGRKAWTKKLVSPKQAEDLLSEEDFAKLSEYVRQREGRPILVSASDARPAIPKLVDRFDDIDTDEED